MTYRKVWGFHRTDGFKEYSEAQTLVFDNDCSLSVFRFKYFGRQFIAIVGDEPPPLIAAKINVIFSEAKTASLLVDIWERLEERRRIANSYGPWVEGHYRQHDT